MDLGDRLSILEDREALRELQYKYGYRLDQRDWKGWAELFTRNATGRFEGWDTVEGRDEIQAFGREVVGGNFEYSAHVTHQPLLRLEGDEATGQRYLDVYYVLSDGTAAWRQGRYDDEFRRVDGEWLFSSVANTFLLRREWRSPQSEPEIENIDGFGDMVVID